jgi:hypothetical protein
MNTAVNFESEWMADGSLRLRFLDREDRILGQQLVAAEGLQALGILVAFAGAKAAGVEPEKILAMFRGFGLDAGPDTVIDLIEAVRVRAGITPEGNIGLESIEDD